ncbi:cytidylyltransferase domain-containing protein [Orenia marismortui]|uniref:Spore coat polysaccharide biosynthesis protein SpsF n=1 Tax=Orenia marismortui TaxID=46469 RepID=A0A4R8HKZ8_9FIRM|nr:glycosyltransferase family protein [Orenia marismortui]TDX58934.1 spore coat polysaccharide biosynthesis protein SpsF [Orenia marismortui]
MQDGKNVVAIVQARMGSTRLPGKVAKNLVGKPMLARLIERLKEAEQVDQIVIATSNKEADDQVVEIAESEEVSYYRGSEKDVLSRYLEAANKFKADIVVRITGDCPLIDPITIDKAALEFLSSKAEYLRINVNDIGYPRGLDAEIFSLKTLLKVEESVIKEEENKDNHYREHVTFYINKYPDEFKFRAYQPPEELRRNYRLCVDEEADFNLIEEIYKRLYREDRIIDILDVIDLLDNNPDLAQINYQVEQKKY